MAEGAEYLAAQSGEQDGGALDEQWILFQIDGLAGAVGAGAGGAESVEAVKVVGYIGDIAGATDGGVVHGDGADAHVFREIGRASCRERVW